jgi:hypothetical protein
MFTRSLLNLVEEPIFHRSPLQTMSAAMMHNNRAKKLAPKDNEENIPYAMKRQQLAHRAADKALTLLNRANAQDKRYERFANKSQ